MSLPRPTCHATQDALPQREAWPRGPRRRPQNCVLTSQPALPPAKSHRRPARAPPRSARHSGAPLSGHPTALLSGLHPVGTGLQARARPRCQLPINMTGGPYEAAIITLKTGPWARGRTPPPCQPATDRQRQQDLGRRPGCGALHASLKPRPQQAHGTPRNAVPASFQRFHTNGE